MNSARRVEGPGGSFVDLDYSTTPPTIIRHMDACSVFRAMPDRPQFIIYLDKIYEYIPETSDFWETAMG